MAKGIATATFCDSLDLGHKALGVKRFTRVKNGHSAFFQGLPLLLAQGQQVLVHHNKVGLQLLKVATKLFKALKIVEFDVVSLKGDLKGRSHHGIGGVQNSFLHGGEILACPPDLVNRRQLVGDCPERRMWWRLMLLLR